MYDELKRLHQSIGNCEAHKFERLSTTDQMVYKCTPHDGTEFYLRIEHPYVIHSGSIYGLQYTVSVMTALQGILETITIAEYVDEKTERGREIVKHHLGSIIKKSSYSYIIASQIEKFGLPVYKNLHYLMKYNMWVKNISGELLLQSTLPEFCTVPGAVKCGDLTYERVLECIEDLDDMTLTIAGCNQFSTLMFVMHGMFESVYNENSTYLPRSYYIENLLDYCYETSNKRKT